MAHVALYLLLFLASGLGTGEGLDPVAQAQLNQCFVSFDQSDADRELNFDDLDEAVPANHTLSVARPTSLSLLKSTDCLVSEHAKCHLIRAPPRSLV